MIRLKTTARCLRTPDVVMALEELGVPYELERVAEGYFGATFGRPGPQLLDGELSIFEPAAIIRHLARQHAPFADGEACRADQWMDFAISQLRPALGRLGTQRRATGGGAPATIADETGRVMSALSAIDGGVRDREYLLGRFTVVDCSFCLLAMLPTFGLDLTPFPALSAYRARLVERPSWTRTMARLHG
jgi:glutathione S-transferase